MACDLVQVPAFLGNKEDYVASLIGAIVCLVTLIAYCVFQVDHMLMPGLPTPLPHIINILLRRR
jgi:hypothetical protein